MADVPEGVCLEAQDGAVTPARRILVSGGTPRDTDTETVFQPKGLLHVDVAPGLWPTGVMEGSLLISNSSVLDQEIAD